MKILLVGINASYMHTNLAIRSIAAYNAAQNGPHVKTIEFSINQPFNYTLQKLYEQQADVYLFSCYIWNIDFICRLGRELKKLLPCCLLFAGGPQVSYHSASFLRANPVFKGTIRGEGEAACHMLFKLLTGYTEELSVIPALTWRREGHIVENPTGSLLNLDSIPFPYQDLAKTKNKTLYYESMRGCPYQCTYCLSSVERGIRIKNIRVMKKDMELLLKQEPLQVKFVDRTFNCNKQRALSIWKWLASHDNGKTNFHFELAGDLLDDESIAFLSTVRPGLFQFEIGVQTCNADTLAAIQRTGSLKRLFQNIDQLQKHKNIHLHLDLIAGLPFENFTSFEQSFNKVFAHRPSQLQLGFLKVLPGTKMETDAQQHGIVWQDTAPFEILYNHWLPYEDITKLKAIATMVDLYYNTGRFQYVVNKLAGSFSSAMQLFSGLAACYNRLGYSENPPGKKAQYELLGHYAREKNILTEALQWLCRFDMARHEKIKFTPDWVQVDGARANRERILAFYENEHLRSAYLTEYDGTSAKQLLKMAHIEVFPFNPMTNEYRECAVLFNYRRRTIAGHAETRIISLPIKN